MKLSKFVAKASKNLCISIPNKRPSLVWCPTQSVKIVPSNKAIQPNTPRIHEMKT